MRKRIKRFLSSLFWTLEDLTEWWPWLSSWFATWSILLDEDIMERIREFRKWEAEGTLFEHTVPFSEVFPEIEEEPEVQGG